MRLAAILVLPATAVLLLAAPPVVSAASGIDEEFTGSVLPKRPGGPPKTEVPSRPALYPASALEVSSRLMSELLPAIRAIGDMVKPALEKSGLQEEIGDILAALNETSSNPLFLFGFDKEDGAANSDASRWLTWPFGDEEEVTRSPQQQQQQQTPTAKQRLSSFFSNWWPELPQGGRPRGGRPQPPTRQATSGSAAQGPPGQKQQHQGGPSQQEDDEEPVPWRTWDPEELDLM